MRKKFIAGAAILTLLMSSPQVSADDDIVIFGGEFEDETTPPAPKKISEPAPAKELPQPPAPPEEPAPPPKPEVVKPQDEPPTQPVNKPAEPEPPPTEEPQPADEPTTIEPTVPAEEPSLPPPEIDSPFNRPAKISDDRERVEEPVVVEQPTPKPNVVPPTPEPVIEQPPTPEPVIEQPPEPEPVTERQPVRKPSTRQSQPQPNLKMLKPRFVKLAVDETYTYYLDKTAVQWKKMPYSSSEYIADVWIRMVEREPQQLDEDMAAYGTDNFNAEISLAREQGYQYPPEDLTVLRSQAYVLEHYYLRPKTNQIQFLCELEVFGRPQNTINERNYDYKNWENLVPGSVESIIYAATLKTIGKSKSSERGHMNFFDMLDEYARISLG